MGRASLDMSLTLMRIIISCGNTNNRACFRSSPSRPVSVPSPARARPSPHPGAPCCWSRKPAGWIWICWGSRCASSCPWPRCTCGARTPQRYANLPGDETKTDTRTEGRSHLMIPSLILLYWSTARFRKMLLSVCKAGKSSLYSPSVVQFKLQRFWAVPVLYLLQDLKGHGTVVVLQRRDVVVAEGQLSPGIYLKIGYWQWSGFKIRKTGGWTGAFVIAVEMSVSFANNVCSSWGIT